MSSLKDCVAAAKLQLNIEVTDYDPWFRKRAYDAMRKFNNPDVIIKKNMTCKIDSNGRIELPSDFYQCIVVRVHQPHHDSDNDSDDHHHQHNHGGYRYYLDTPFFQNCGFHDRGNVRCGSFQINGSFIQFNGDFKKMYEASMTYLAYQSDKDGEICVPDSYEECIMYFLCYQFSLMKEKPAIILAEYRGNYNATFNKINGDAQVNFFARVRPQIMEAFNSVVGNKNIYITK